MDGKDDILDELVAGRRTHEFKLPSGKVITVREPNVDLVVDMWRQLVAAHPDEKDPATEKARTRLLKELCLLHLCSRPDGSPLFKDLEAVHAAREKSAWKRGGLNELESVALAFYNGNDLPEVGKPHEAGKSDSTVPSDSSSRSPTGSEGAPPPSGEA